MTRNIRNVATNQIEVIMEKGKIIFENESENFQKKEKLTGDQLRRMSHREFEEKHLGRDTRSDFRPEQASAAEAAKCYTTHHHACACREEYFAELEFEIDALKRERDNLQTALDEESRRRWADGVWLIKNDDGGREASLITKLSDLPDPAEFASFARHKDAIGKAMMKLWREKFKTMEELKSCTTSQSEFTETVLEAIAEALEAKEAK